MCHACFDSVLVRSAKRIKYKCVDCGETIRPQSAEYSHPIGHVRTHVDWTGAFMIGDIPDKVVVRCHKKCKGVKCAHCEQGFDRCPCESVIEVFTDLHPGRSELNYVAVRRSGESFPYTKGRWFDLDEPPVICLAADGPPPVWCNHPVLNLLDP